jgi:chemotaxis protein MotB
MARPDREELRRQLEISEQKRAVLQKRLAVESSDDDATLWSFVDLLSLLLILFILFYSHSVVNNLSMADALTQPQKDPVAQPVPDVETSIAASLAAELHPEHEQDEPDPENTNRETPDKRLKKLQRQLLEAVSKSVQDDLSVHWSEKRLVVTMGERILFEVGMANLLSESEPALKQIAEFIAPQIDYRILVAGHTDNTPIRTPQFPSNWELSTARAVNVAKFLIANGIDPERVSVEGYSSYRPLRTNNTPQNKQANRRVEITLFKDSQSNIRSDSP